ncbi:MAG: DUF2384 domain-containing protein [Candidatus Obscuribacterales bacterium]|nr:DUF2384 domain-containing protein [Candidatus Obscuribacterales bacterium]
MKNTALNLENLSELPFGCQVNTLRKLFGFNKTEFAEILGVNTKTIQRWEDELNETPSSSGNRQAIDTLVTIAESLGDLFEPDMIKVWVERPNPALQGERPKDFVKKPGGIFLMGHLLGNLGR